MIDKKYRINKLEYTMKFYAPYYLKLKKKKFKQNAIFHLSPNIIRQTIIF